MDLFLLGIILAIIFIVIINYVFFYDRKKFRYRKNIHTEQKIPADVPSHKPDTLMPATAVPSTNNIDFVHAGFLRRLAAFMIDFIMYFFIIFGVALFGAILNINSDTLGIILAITFYPIIILYFALFDAGLGKLNATPGKKLLSIVVITNQLQQVSFGRSFARSLLKVIFLTLLISMWILSISSTIPWIVPVIGIFFLFPPLSFSDLLTLRSPRAIWDIIVKTRVVLDPNKEWIKNGIPVRDPPAIKAQTGSKPTEVYPNPESIPNSPHHLKTVQNFLSKKSFITMLIVGFLVIATIFALSSAQTKPISNTYAEPTQLIVPTKESQKVTTVVPTLRTDAVISIPFHEKIALNDITITRSFQSEKAPIRISLTTEPKMINDTKFIFSGHNDNSGTEKIITRADENAYSQIIVRDFTSGNVVALNGYGKQYSSDTLKVINIMKEGHYKIEITGSKATADLAISI